MDTQSDIPAPLPQTQPPTIPPPSTPQPEKPIDRFKTLKFELKLLIFLIFVGVSLFTIYTLKSRGGNITSPTNENKNLVILNMSPSGYATGVPGSIKIEFSDSVDVHDIVHAFEIVPDIKGSFSPSRSGKLHSFVPKEPFLENTSYSVKIKSGLKSKTNKVLLEDYTNTFITQKKIDEIQFVKDEVRGKILNYAAGTIAFEVRTDALGSGAEAFLYEATEQDLLSYLIYNQKTRDSNGYAYTEDEYGDDFSFDPKTHKLLQTFKLEDSNTPITTNLKSGIYLLVGRKNASQQIAGLSFVMVNDTGIILRQDDEKVVLSAFDLAKDTSINDPISLSFYTLAGTPRKFSEQILYGTGSYPIAYAERLDMIIGKKGNETIVVPIKLPNSLADIRVSYNLNETLKLFVYTDRPIYKSGDTIHFRGVARIDQDALYKVPPAGTQIRLFLGQNENPLYETITRTNDHGVFYGEFTAPKIEIQNEYEQTQYLYATADISGKKPYEQSAYAYFDIVDYKKPDFELVTKVDKQEALQHEELTFTINGLYFNGTPVKNEAIDYKLYSQNFYETEKKIYNSNFKLSSQGGMCGGGLGVGDEWYGDELPEKGTISLNNNGSATVSFKPSKRVDLLSQKITFVAEKKDSKGNTIVSAISSVVHAGNFSIFYPPSATGYAPGETITIPFYAEKLDGSPVANGDFSYKLLAITSSAGSSSNENIITSGTVQTDASGKATVSFVFPEKLTENDILYFSLQSPDQYGNTVESRKSLYVVSKNQQKEYYRDYWNSDTQTFLKMVSSNNSYINGETITLSVTSPKELDVLLTLERGRVYRPEKIHLNKGVNTVQIPVSPDLSPSVTVVLSFFANKEYYSEGMALNIPAMHKLLTVTVAAEKSRYYPSETARIRLTTKNSNGAPVQAQLSLAVVDKAIFSLRKNATPVFHSTYYAYRSRTTNASSSLTPVGTYEWGGGGGGGGGGLSQVPLADTLYFNPNITTDANGEAIIDIPLQNIQTTWNVVALGSTDASDIGQSETNLIAAP